jgi:hypothetical protein
MSGNYRVTHTLKETHQTLADPEQGARPKLRGNPRLELLRFLLQEGYGGHGCTRVMKFQATLA